MRVEQADAKATPASTTKHNKITKALILLLISLSFSKNKVNENRDKKKLFLIANKQKFMVIRELILKVRLFLVKFLFQLF